MSWRSEEFSRDIALHLHSLAEICFSLRSPLCMNTSPVLSQGKWFLYCLLCSLKCSCLLWPRPSLEPFPEACVTAASDLLLQLLEWLFSACPSEVDCYRTHTAMHPGWLEMIFISFLVGLYCSGKMQLAYTSEEFIMWCWSEFHGLKKIKYFALVVTSIL